MKFRQLLLCLAFALLADKPVAAEPKIGIGVMLGTAVVDEMPILVVAGVIPNSPAERAGLPKGAIIEKINGVPTVGRTIEECITQIKGPEGIPVLLEFTDPATGKSKKMMIVRGKFEIGGGD